MLIPTALTTLVIGACAIIPGCQPAPLAACTAEYGGQLADGTIVVTIEHDASVPCDLDGSMRLDLVWNARTEGPDWGGDASVQNAEREMLDAGCTPTWHNDGGEFWGLGVNCNF